MTFEPRRRPGGQEWPPRDQPMHVQGNVQPNAQMQGPYQQQPQGYPPQQQWQGPPRQPPRRRKRGPARTIAWSVIGGAVAVIAIAIAASGHSGGSPAASSSGATQAASTPGAAARTIDACRARKPSGDLYVRTAEPGLAAQAQEIGGEWNWDYTTSQCLDALNFTVATAGTAAGECTTAGYVADNPRYDAAAVPAAPIRHLAGEAGPGC